MNLVESSRHMTHGNRHIQAEYTGHQAIRDEPARIRDWDLATTQSEWVEASPIAAPRMTPACKTPRRNDPILETRQQSEHECPDATRGVGKGEGGGRGPYLQMRLNRIAEHYKGRLWMTATENRPKDLSRATSCRQYCLKLRATVWWYVPLAEPVGLQR